MRKENKVLVLEMKVKGQGNKKRTQRKENREKFEEEKRQVKKNKRRILNALKKTPLYDSLCKDYDFLG